MQTNYYSNDPTPKNNDGADTAMLVVAIIAALVILGVGYAWYSSTHNSAYETSTVSSTAPNTATVPSTTTTETTRSTSTETVSPYMADTNDAVSTNDNAGATTQNTDTTTTTTTTTEQ